MKNFLKFINEEIEKIGNDQSEFSEGKEYVDANGQIWLVEQKQQDQLSVKNEQSGETKVTSTEEFKGILKNQQQLQVSPIDAKKQLITQGLKLSKMGQELIDASNDKDCTQKEILNKQGKDLIEQGKKLICQAQQFVQPQKKMSCDDCQKSIQIAQQIIKGGKKLITQAQTLINNAYEINQEQEDPQEQREQQKVIKQSRSLVVAGKELIKQAQQIIDDLPKKSLNQEQQAQIKNQVSDACQKCKDCADNVELQLKSNKKIENCYEAVESNQQQIEAIQNQLDDIAKQVEDLKQQPNTSEESPKETSDEEVEEEEVEVEDSAEESDEDSAEDVANKLVQQSQEIVKNEDSDETQNLLKISQQVQDFVCQNKSPEEATRLLKDIANKVRDVKDARMLSQSVSEKDKNLCQQLDNLESGAKELQLKIDSATAQA